jgi:predicted GTPase
MENNDYLNNLSSDIQNMNISEEDKKKIQENLLNLKKEKINLMITGATGCGKSSTINALFGEEVAKVGSIDPETMTIAKYDLNNLVIWDTPGLGDGIEKDRQHAVNIARKLQEKDANGDLLIDLVLVILDGSSRDLGTSYELIRNVIIPNLGPEKESRILVAINQCDMAMKGRYWDEENNKPEPRLVEFLEAKANSVRERILEGTGINTSPIYYSAGFKEEGMPQVQPYNLSKLLYYLVKYTPVRKRLSYIDHINEDPRVWEDDDKIKDYKVETEKGFWETAKEYALKGLKFVNEHKEEIINFIIAVASRGKGGKFGKTVKKILKFFK